MAHYAILNGENLVIQVIVGKDETDDTHNWEEYYKGKRTSYNTSGGVHYDSDGNPDGGEALRKNYAGIGYTYDGVRDAFIPPKQYQSWTLNEDTCQWDAPTAMPDDGKVYEWNEGTTSWDEVSE